MILKKPSGSISNTFVFAVFLQVHDQLLDLDSALVQNGHPSGHFRIGDSMIKYPLAIILVILITKEGFEYLLNQLKGH